MKNIETKFEFIETNQFLYHNCIVSCFLQNNDQIKFFSDCFGKHDAVQKARKFREYFLGNNKEYTQKRIEESKAFLNTMRKARNY